MEKKESLFEGPFRSHYSRFLTFLLDKHIFSAFYFNFGLGMALS